MGTSDEHDPAKPTEQTGGTAPGDQEAAEKGPWAATATDGLVPEHLGGSDAPPELQDDDPELGSEVTGTTTGSDEPATDAGIDLSAGEHADATSQGAPDGAVLPGDDAAPDRDHEPNQRDAAVGPRQSDLKSAD